MATKIKTQTVCKVMQVRANCIQGVYMSKADLERYNPDNVTLEDGRVAYFIPANGWNINAQGSAIVGYEARGHVNIVEAEEEWLVLEVPGGFSNVELEKQGLGEATMNQPRGKGLAPSRRLLCRTQYDYDRAMAYIAHERAEAA